MSLADHLRELRNRLLICVAAVVVGGIVGWIQYQPLLLFLERPLASLEGRNGWGQVGLNYQGITTPFGLQLTVALWLGVILASPVWLYQLWAFIVPGLTKREKRTAVAFIFAAVPLFFAGETKQFLPELAELQVGPQIHHESFRGMQPVIRGNRDEYLVAHATGIHHQTVRVCLQHHASEPRDHARELAPPNGPVNPRPRMLSSFQQRRSKWGGGSARFSWGILWSLFLAIAKPKSKGVQRSESGCNYLMFVLLYLLPLGLIFDLAGYMPGEARLFLVFGLLALPLCLRPSRRAGWMGAGLLAVALVRTIFQLPPIAETALLLLAHLAVWSVVAEVPRPLRAGVVAFAFLHLLLFISPLGQPVLETLTTAGNDAARWIAGQPFHLGPTYLGLGGLLLFLTLSIFGWDGTKAGWLRTAGFLVIALLIEALAAVVLIEKTDFAASFAWSLKFRDPMGFPELWTLLKGLGVIVFPAFLFLAQLAAYMALHFGRSGKSEPADAADAPSPLRREISFGKPAVVVAILAALTVIAAAPPTSWRRPAKLDMIFVDRGVVSFTKPDYERYGESAGGMFGMLPEYARLFGATTAVVKDIPETLDPSKTLVLTNLDQDLGAETLKRVWEFVSNGGRLWVLGDHTFIKNGRNHLNEILEPTHISFNNDSAQFFPQGWFHSYRYPQGTPFSELGDDAENRPSILVGASLEIRTPAVPLVMGRFAYADLGTTESEADRGYLGDFKYQPSERLGDLVLVAGERHGKGRVLVFGDTSSFFNNNLTRSFELLRCCLAWLGDSNMWSFYTSLAGRIAAAVLTAGIVLLAFFWRDRPIGVAALAAAGAVSFLTHGSGGLPDYDRTFSREQLAIIDFSHQPNASKHSAMDGGLHGVSINLMRHGALPITANVWDSNLLDEAKYLFLIAPRQPLGGSARGDVMDFMKRGGTVILTCGYLDADGSHELLEQLGCEIGDTPLGRFFNLQAFGQPVSFMSAWGISKIPPNAKVLCGSPDWPLIVALPHGSGQLVLIADSEFLQNRNLEGHKNHDPANTAFMKNLLDSTIR